MKRVILLLLLAILAVGWAGLMSADFGQQQPVAAADGSFATITYVDKTTFATVTAYISVLDSSGQPVRGLTQQDFAVAEDGWPVDIDGFVGGGHQPVTAVMLIDRSGSMDEDGKMADARAAALTFLDHLQDGRDRLGVIAFDDEVDRLQSLQTMNGSLRAHLRSEIGSLRTQGSTAYYDAK